MALCQFTRISPKAIRCANCGVERTHPGNPASYVRECGLEPIGEPQPAPVLSPCIHLGDVVERGLCNVCGMKGQPFKIHACELYVRCMIKRYRNDRPDVKVCFSCEDYQQITTE